MAGTKPCHDERTVVSKDTVARDQALAVGVRKGDLDPMWRRREANDDRRLPAGGLPYPSTCGSTNVASGWPVSAI
jgi:hypothetical protein